MSGEASLPTFTTTVHQDMTGYDQRFAALGHFFIIPNAFSFFSDATNQNLRRQIFSPDASVMHRSSHCDQRTQIAAKIFFLSEKAIFFKVK